MLLMLCIPQATQHMWWMDVWASLASDDVHDMLQYVHPMIICSVLGVNFPQLPDTCINYGTTSKYTSVLHLPYMK